MCSETRQDRIKNDTTWERWGIVKKIVEIRLRWFGHIDVDFIVRRIDEIDDSQIIRDREKSRKTIRKGIEINELDGDVIYDRTL